MQPRESEALRTAVRIPRLVGRRLLVTFLVLAVIASTPAAAQSNIVCDAAKLPGMIEGFFQLSTGLGVVGLVLVWQVNTLMDMFTLSPDQKKGLKRHKRGALRSAIVLVTLGPLYTVGGSMMNLPLAECLNLTPW